MTLNIQKLAMLSSVSKVVDSSKNGRAALSVVLKLAADYMHMREGLFNATR